MKKSFVAAGVAMVCAGVLAGGTAYAAGANDILSADGYHGLRLGMSEQDAQGTGQLGALDWNDGWCNRYSTVDRPTDGRSVAISHRFGVVELRVPDSARTPEGIGAGSTVAELKAAYPNAVSYRDGFTVTVPGHADRFYDFWVDGDQEPYSDDARITKLGLNSVSYDCAT